MVFLVWEHLSSRKGAADSGSQPMIRRVASRHYTGHSLQESQGAQGSILPALGGCAFPRARAGGRWLEGSDTQFYEGCPSLGHCAGSVGSECVRKVQWGPRGGCAGGMEREGMAAACWAKEGEVGKEEACSLLEICTFSLLKQNNSSSPPKSLPASTQRSSSARGQHMQDGGGKDGGVEEVVMSNEYPECIEIYIFFISEKVPLRGRQP